MKFMNQPSIYLTEEEQAGLDKLSERENGGDLPYFKQLRKKWDCLGMLILFLLMRMPL
jgi:hypothetical protein